MQAGVQSYFAINQTQDKISQKQAGVVTSPKMSFGTFSTNLKTDYRFGLAVRIKPSGVMMDIDRILKQAVDKENKMENLASFNRSAGVRESLNENLIPEQLFDNPNTKEKEAQGISAVKALQIASKEGQTIYTINQDNYSQILPKLNHSSDVMRDVANAVNAGKEVTISECQIRAFGWSGSGFIVLDPYTGYGAYLIDGGKNGGYAEIKDSKGNSFSLIAFMPSLNLFNSTFVELDPYYKNISEKLDNLARQVNKFYECNKEAILSLGVAIAISIAIALAIKTEVISLGTATPVVVPIIATLTTMYPATASASSNIFTECTCPSGIFGNDPTPRSQCWICHPNLHPISTSKVEQAKNRTNELGKCIDQGKNISLEYLNERVSAWSKLVDVREEHNMCYDKEGPRHKQARDQALTVVQDCLKLYRKLKP